MKVDKVLNEIRTHNTPHIAALKEQYFNSQCMKDLYRLKIKIPITKEMKSELCDRKIRPIIYVEEGQKKPKKVNKEEKKFEDMVKSYKNTFAGISEKTEIKEPENPRKDISKKRWFEE